jgi:sugar O-acyltransferase (sialic acid O-acetyltransferase NeuD family)
MKNIALIGYSGHAFVAAEIFASQKKTVNAYVDVEEKLVNPYHLKWLGTEHEPSTIEKLKDFDYFVSTGDNLLRKKLTMLLMQQTGQQPVNAFHISSVISSSLIRGCGNMTAANVTINAQVKIGNGVICNTACIIEHECSIDDYVHIAPGAVLCGNVSIGECSFIGANAVIKQGIKIGKNVVVGAGAVILKDIPDNKKAVGNPHRII